MFSLGTSPALAEQYAVRRDRLHSFFLRERVIQALSVLPDTSPLLPVVDVLHTPDVTPAAARHLSNVLLTVFAKASRLVQHRLQRCTRATLGACSGCVSPALRPSLKIAACVERE